MANQPWAPGQGFDGSVTCGVWVDEAPAWSTLAGPPCYGLMMGLLLADWQTGLLLAVVMLVVPALFLPIWLWQASRSPNPLAWRLDAFGLHELWRLRRRRTHPWPTLRGVTENEAAIVVETADDEVVIPRRAKRFGLFYHRLRQAFVPPSQAQTVGPERIAEWLGIPLDGALETGMTADERKGLVALMLALPVPFLAGLGASGTVAVMVESIALLVGLMAWRKTEPVRVTAHGFYQGRERILGWDEVFEPLGRYDGAMLAGGTRIPLTDEHRARVNRAVEQLVAAKESGAEVTRLTDIPDTALSRASDGTASAELGLSLTEREPGRTGGGR